MVQHILVFAVRVYRWVISPAKTFLFGPLSQCRFTPSCSVYAMEAVTRHGALRGSGLALKRICRCHPWGGCGDDPVPPLSRVNRRRSPETSPHLPISGQESRSACVNIPDHAENFGAIGVSRRTQAAESGN